MNALDKYRELAVRFIEDDERLGKSLAKDKLILFEDREAAAQAITDLLKRLEVAEKALKYYAEPIPTPTDGVKTFDVYLVHQMSLAKEALEKIRSEEPL